MIQQNNNSVTYCIYVENIIIYKSIYYILFSSLQEALQEKYVYMIKNAIAFATQTTLKFAF